MVSLCISVQKRFAILGDLPFSGHSQCVSGYKYRKNIDFLTTLPYFFKNGCYLSID